MTIDEALERVREIREFVADCDVCNNGGQDDTFRLDLEALDLVLAVASGKADPRQMALPVGEGKP